MVTTFMPVVDLDAYYAGRLTEQPALSQTIAGELASRSAKHAWAKHPRLGGKVFAPTDEMELGNVLDELVLGGSRRIVSLPFDDYRTKDAKAARDAARAAGKIPVKESKLAELQEVAARAVKSFHYAGVELTGISQACVLWEAKASNGNSVQCQCLMDHLLIDERVIYDLKTADNASPGKLGAKCVTYSYDIQSHAYREALDAALPDFTRETTFKNVWLETSWPNETLVTEPDLDMQALGAARWQRAVDVWEECLRLDRWPGYATRGEVLRVAPPRWAIEMEEVAW